MQAVREMIDKLIAFDTVSRHSNLELIHYIQDYLQGHGVESHLVHNEDKSKANLYATIGPMVDGGFVFSGHTDVVPVDGQAWDTDPFTAVEKNNRLYGRGTCDMKVFVAIVLARVPFMLSLDLKLPVHLAFSYDEEVGCVGAPSLVAEMVKNLPAIQGVVVGEPTNMEVANMHKGIIGHKTTVTGLEAHSSKTNLGVSANFTAAKLICFLDNVFDSLKKNPQSELQNLEPAHSTISVGLIKGGIATNIIPRHCEFTWDLRNVPKDDPQQILQEYLDYSESLITEMRKTSEACNIETAIGSSAPSLSLEKDNNAEAICCALTGNKNSIAVAYATEAGIFQTAGYSCVVCGPGSIDQAHKPNEYIEISQIEECIRFVERLARKLSV